VSTPSDTARPGTEPDEPQRDEPQPDEPQPGGPAATRAMRATRQRAAVSGLLDRVADFRSAQEIHEELRRVGEGIGLTTVYRTLQALADAGEVDVLRTGSGEAVYRRCASDDHHHHLVCRRCGRAVEIAGPAVETWAQRVADEHGFTDLSHTVEIFGLCRECSAARPTG
jgi:Fur family ferric uptake transcriptional regulator